MNMSFPKLHRLVLLAVLFSTLTAPSLPAAELESKPDDAYFTKFAPVKAPATASLLLQPGDRLAIIGDSITEQRMYSRILDT